MKTAEELYQLLGEAEDMPYGAAQIAVVEQVLRYADGPGDPQLSFLARLIATGAYVYGGEPAKAFVTFSWCISDLDNNPQPYHQEHLHTLLWVFKAMVNAMTKFPEIPLARTYAVLDDMERRYREFGQGTQVVYKYRYLVAEHVGDQGEADAWYARWQAAPRDSLSDCQGCDPSDVAEYLSSRGRYADAVEHADPVLAGRLTCNEQPQRILNELMVPYLLNGREQDAVDAHRRSYRLERGNLADMSDIAAHIAFCARTGNEQRGLEILQRHLDWLPKAPSPAAAMDFAAAGGLLLRRVDELGHGDATIRRRDLPDTTAAALATELTYQATDLAKRFDERNGTDAQSRRVAARLNAEPFPAGVSLSPTARPAVAPPASPTTEPAPEIPAQADPAELLDLADQYATDEREAALAATLAAFDARFGDGAELGPLLAGRRAALRHQDDWQANPEATAVSWAAAADLLTEGGGLDEAAATRGRLGVLYCLTGRSDEGLALVRAEVAQADSTGDPVRRARAWTRLAIAQFTRDAFADAIESLDQARAAAEGHPRQLAAQSVWRARVLEGQEHREEALTELRSARDFFRANGPVSRLAEVTVLLGGLSTDPAEMLDAFGEAIDTRVPEAQLPARGSRGRVLLHLDRGADAVPDLVEAVAIATEHDLAELSAAARLDLANAYRMAGRPIEAAEVGEEALLRFDQLEMTGPADDTRFMLAGLYREIGDRDGALALYQDVLTRLDDNPAGRGQVGEATGGLLYEMDRDAEAAETFRSAAEAMHEAGDLIGELRVLRRRISALHYADDAPAALAVLDQADKLFTDLPPDLADDPNAVYQRSMTAQEVAGLLMARERFAEAVPQLRGVPERLRAIGATAEADGIETMLGEALLRAGQAKDAVTLLDGLLDHLEMDSPIRNSVIELRDEARTASKGERRFRFGPGGSDGSPGEWRDA
ncbi:MAG: tetratricopeptide repeat protein [Actinoplanes sp.]